MTNRPFLLEEKIKAEALRLGFSFCHITDASPLDHYDHYHQWLDQNHHAEMHYLASERHRETRKDPHHLMSAVQSILCLGWSYALCLSDDSNNSDRAMIAGYASGQDYHVYLPEKMERLAGFISETSGRELQFKAFTDSSPILERELAARAGVGWTGKNTCLISPKFGSSFLLAEIFLDLPLLPDPPFTADRCGTCDRCIQACPTQCILPNRTLDAHKCISYLTIENKGEIPEELRSSIDHWFFGCDVCQSVCPWNQKSITQSFSPDNLTFSSSDLLELISFNPVEIENRFQNSALSRARWKGLVRNALIYLGNSSNPSFVEVIKPWLDDPDISSVALWAINQIVNSTTQ